MKEISVFLFAIQVLAAPMFAEELIVEPVPFWNGKIREGRWAGAHLFLKNGGEKPKILEIDAWLSTTTFDDVHYRKIVQLPVGAVKRVPFYLRGIFRPDEMRFVCRDAESGKKTRVAIQVSPMSSPVHMAVVGRPIPFLDEETLAALKEVSPEKTGDGITLVRLDMLPERSEGLDSLDILVLGESRFEELNTRQAEAIHSWVERGGILLLAPGRFWQSLANKLPVSLLPARNFRSVDDLGEKGVAGPGVGARFRFDAIIEPENDRDFGVPVHRWLRGRGTVCLLACLPAQIGEIPKGEVQRLWKGILKLRRDNFSEESQNHGYLKPESALGGLLASRGSGSVGLGWALLFVVVYLCIVGPGDMILVRKLKRPVLTWVTFPLLVVVFSGFSYWRTYSTKAGPMRVRQLSIVDVSSIRDVRHTRTWTNVFSQQNRKYQLRSEVEGGLWSSAGNWQTSGIGSRAVAMQENQAASMDTKIPIWTSRLIRVDHTLEGKWLKAAVTENDVTIELDAGTGMTLSHCVLIHGDEVVSLPDELRSERMLVFPRRSNLKLQPWLSGIAQKGPLPFLMYGNQQCTGEQVRRMLYLFSFHSQWDSGVSQMMTQHQDQIQNDWFLDLSELSRERYCFLAWVNQAAVDIEYVDTDPRLESLTLVRFCFPLELTEETEE
ncbi:MAG: hypothetical protein QF473_36270 [Planctomycetota bacterium]|nr:hypothetical protein [Planctomycetota bacterium]